ncbi:hypothetical protein BHE74_00007560 [Ensete ventricosum]|nr:hypothetical protein BHE74_00007560 [Ensete ventricosum]RZR81690.1 hypothetical protein BHM03_00007973 [Ensete ventricosum]
MSSWLSSSRVHKDVCAASVDGSGWCVDSEGGLPGNPRLVDPLIPKSDSYVLHQGLSRRCGCLDSAPLAIKLAIRSPVLECGSHELKSPLFIVLPGCLLSSLRVEGLVQGCLMCEGAGSEPSYEVV